MRRSLVFALVLTFVSVAASAFAQECVLYTKSNSSAPQVIQNYLSHQNAAGVISCREMRDTWEVSSLTKQDGVCDFFAWKLQAADREKSLKRASNQAFLYMLEAPGMCPRPDVVQYVPTTDITPREFFELSRCLSAATSSQETFDRAFRGTSFRSIFVAADSFQRFRTYMLSTKGHVSVLRTARTAGYGLFVSFNVDILNTQDRGRFYSVRVNRWFGKWYSISAVNEGVM